MILKTLIFSLVITALIMLVIFINKKNGKKDEFRVRNCSSDLETGECAGCGIIHEANCNHS